MKNVHGDCSQYIGQRVGSLVVESVITDSVSTGKKTYNRKRLECVCDCGGRMSLPPISFVEGRVSSCSSCRLRSMYSDVIGNRYGRLVVDEILSDKGRGILARCTCSCGVHKVIPLRCILGNRIKSCGCLVVDVAREKLASDGYLGNILTVRNSRTKPNVTNKVGYKNICQPKGSNGYRVSVMRNGEAMYRDVRTLEEALRVREEFLAYFRGKSNGGK